MEFRWTREAWLSSRPGSLAYLLEKSTTLSHSSQRGLAVTSKQPSRIGGKTGSGGRLPPGGEDLRQHLLGHLLRKRLRMASNLSRCRRTDSMAVTARSRSFRAWLGHWRSIGTLSWSYMANSK